MKKPTYYGCANNGADRFGILAVTVKIGRSSQEWTGETFSTWPAAVARVEALNRQLFAGDLAVAS